MLAAAMAGVSLTFVLFCYSAYFTVVAPQPRVFTMAIKVQETGVDENGNTFIVPYPTENIRFRDGYVAYNPYWRTRAVFKGAHNFTVGSLYQIRCYQSAPNEPYTLVLSQRAP